MIPEPYLGLLVGSILTLVVSVVSVFLTNHFSERHWQKAKSVEQEEQVANEVLSPLYFMLEDAPYRLGYVGGTLESVLSSDLSDESIQERARETLDECGRENVQSDEIKGIMLTRLGMISPRDLREDLFQYYNFTKWLERGLIDFYFDSDVELTRKRLEKLKKASDALSNVSAGIAEYLEPLLSSSGKPPSDSKYKKVIDDKTQYKLMKLLIAS